MESEICETCGKQLSDLRIKTEDPMFCCRWVVMR
jgi:hypothetical protein